jgi:hypothetical protein
VVSLERLPFESEFVFVVTVSVFTFRPLSFVSVAVTVLDSVVVCSVFWATRAAVVRSDTNMSSFIGSFQPELYGVLPRIIKIGYRPFTLPGFRSDNYLAAHHGAIIQSIVKSPCTAS